MKLKTTVTAAAVTAAMTFGAAYAVSAQESGLPNVVSWSAYDTGSSGHAQAIAIGGALKNELNVDLRILPGRNDVSRMVPLRDRRVQFSSAGIAAFYAQEGTDMFSEEAWGPQPLRMLVSSNPDHNQGLAATRESGVETLADVAGKRVAVVVGSPAINNGTEAILAFAGLGWDDVQAVEFPGYGAAWDGMLNGQADVAWAATTISAAYQLANSPRGINWLTVSHDDEEGWQRLNAVAPHIFPHVATEGADISAETPHEGTNYPYPILIAYADQDEDMVYAMTKAMIDLYPVYEDAAPGINGWALEKQNLQWIIPYHEGAIRALTEAGAWTEEAQAHNDRLVERQEQLAAAWEELGDLSGDERTAAWAEAREAIDAASASDG